MNNKDALNTRKISEVLIETRNRLEGIPQGSIRLVDFDSSNGIGVGISSEGDAVLVLPGQSNVTSFETKYAAFDPWLELNEIEDNRLLTDKAILKCKLDADNLKTIEAISAIFVGVIDLQKRFGECGAAIWQMKTVFDSGFIVDIPDKSIVGLIGEIVVLLDSDNIEEAFSFWRNENFAKYDFSGSNFRLDAKSTLSDKRIHHFSSGQIPGQNPEITFIASILVNRVERGTSFSDFVTFFVNKLNNRNQGIAIQRIIETLGIHHSYVMDFEFDYEATLDSIRFLASGDIPCPVQNSGVLSMNWKADVEFNSQKFIDFDFLA
jgi:hypothetical protein